MGEWIQKHNGSNSNDKLPDIPGTDHSHLVQARCWRYPFLLVVSEAWMRLTKLKWTTGEGRVSVASKYEYFYCVLLGREVLVAFEHARIFKMWNGECGVCEECVWFCVCLYPFELTKLELSKHCNIFNTLIILYSEDWSSFLCRRVKLWFFDNMFVIHNIYHAWYSELHNRKRSSLRFSRLVAKQVKAHIV